MGDNIIYNSDTNEVIGDGHVIIKHEDMSLFADKVYINTESGDVSAEGNVLLLDATMKVQTDKLYYNIKDKTAYTKDVNITMKPWVARGEKMLHEGNKWELENPVFTTCLDKQPHYRLQSSMVYFYQDDKIEAWNTVIYEGMIPVFYFPYFSAPVKNPKSPIEFNFGHDDSQGWYIYTKYNFFTDFYNFGSVGYDYMEKLGNKYTLDLTYGFNKNSTGNMNGFYNLDKSTNTARWQGNFTHNQIFNDLTRGGINIQALSDKNLNKDNLSNLEDNFTQQSNAYFNTSLGSHSFSVSVADTEQLNTITGKYYTISRTLPNFSYNMTSWQLLPRIYYNHSFSATRIFDSLANAYDDSGTWSSALQLSLPPLSIASLSGNAGFSSFWQNSEKDKKWGSLLNNANLSETLSLNFVPGLFNLSLTHTYSKQLNKNKDLAYTGIMSNILSPSLLLSVGNLRVNANTTYDMRKNSYEVINDRDRFSMLNVYANTSVAGAYFTANSTYSIFANQIKSTAVGFNLSDTEKSLWSFAANTSFVSNLVDASGHTQTGVADSLTFDTGLSFALTEEFRVSIARGYDFMTKKLVSHSYGLNWYVHCWEADVTWTKREDNVEEIFFSIFISALPEFKLNKPSTAAPNYNLLFGQQ
jgi:hypothetical protein